MYNKKNPLFYVCMKHKHFHKHEYQPFAQAACYVQTLKCCDQAELVKDLNTSFVLSITEKNLKSKNIKEWKYKATAPKLRKIESSVGGSSNIVPFEVYASTSENSDDCDEDDDADDGRGCTINEDSDQAKKCKLWHKVIVTRKRDLNEIYYTEKEYVIYSPSLWKEQSMHHFISLIRSILIMPKLIDYRYKAFEKSSFKLSNIQLYKSGKQSIVRTAFTGFETPGIYQTSTMSCLLKRDQLLIPQNLYDIIKEKFFLDYVVLKRDPSIKTTCAFVLKPQRNPDPENKTIVIPSDLAKLLNQDQDGDKNGIYLLQRSLKYGYDRKYSFMHKIATMEMADAIKKTVTLIASPRISMAEHNIVQMYRHRKELELMDPDFFAKTYHHGIEYMTNAGCGYRREEYEKFAELLIRMNEERWLSSFLTVDDIVHETENIASIVYSGAKGHPSTLKMLYYNLLTTKTLNDQKLEMLEQMSRYISSGQELRTTGRNQFICLYAAHDLIVFLGKIFLNKVFFACFLKYTSIYTLLYSEASLNEFFNDLVNL